MCPMSPRAGSPTSTRKNVSHLATANSHVISHTTTHTWYASARYTSRWMRVVLAACALSIENPGSTHLNFSGRFWKIGDVADTLSQKRTLDSPMPSHTANKVQDIPHHRPKLALSLPCHPTCVTSCASVRLHPLCRLLKAWFHLTAYTSHFVLCACSIAGLLRTKYASSIAGTKAAEQGHQLQPSTLLAFWCVRCGAKALHVFYRHVVCTCLQRGPKKSHVGYQSCLFNAWSWGRSAWRCECSLPLRATFPGGLLATMI